MKSVLVFLILMLVFPLISGDIISINSGGSQNIAITPSPEIEGFFFGDNGSICGNSIIESGETCDDGNAVSGDGCSNLCQTETPTDTGGGGGGGGGGGSPSISVTPNQFNINLAVNTNTEETIVITNLGTSTTTVSISQQGLTGNILLNTSSITIPGGETVNVSVIFLATDDVGIFNGIIYVGSRSIPVSINVATELLLFDSNIIVLNEDYQVQQGDRLRTEVTLLPFGDPTRLDVNLFYTIRDSQGRVYLTNSETLLIEEELNFRRNFGTGALPVGQYVIGLELVYPNGVAPSSAFFEVIEKEPLLIFGKIVLFLMICILIVLILIIILWIIRERDKNKESPAK